MPGVPPDAVDQLKRVFQGLFKKKSKTSAGEQAVKPTATTQPEQQQQQQKPTSTTPAAPQPAPAAGAAATGASVASDPPNANVPVAAKSSVSQNTEPAKPVPGTAPAPVDTQPKVTTEKAPEPKETAPTSSPDVQTKEPMTTATTGASVSKPTPVPKEHNANGGQTTATVTEDKHEAAPASTPAAAPVPAPTPSAAPVVGPTTTQAPAPAPKPTEPASLPQKDAPVTTATSTATAITSDKPSGSTSK